MADERDAVAASVPGPAGIEAPGGPARADSPAPDSATPAAVPASAGTRGFLFSDLRGYTAFVERAGDRAAAELLASYRSLVREVIAGHFGAEIKTEGDSFYVVFPNASAAVEAGLSIVREAGEQSIPERPIRVGVGIHAGETVATTEGLVGGAVNIAARVCSKAQPGEVLVTDTVRALTRTFLPYRYTSLGTQQLKGIAGGIPLFRVEPTPSTRRARLRRQLSARRGRVTLALGLVVVLSAVGVGVYAANRGPDCLTLPAATKDVAAKIDPARNCVVATYEVGQRPGPIVATGDGRLWVANRDDQTVSIVDATTGRVHTTGAGGTPDALAVGPSSVWVLDATAGVLSEISLTAERPVTRRVLPYPEFITQHQGDPIFRSLRGGSGYDDIAFLGRRIWVTNRVMGQVLPVSPDVGLSQYAPIPDTGAIQVGPPPDTRSAGSAPYVVSGTGPVATAQGTVWIASDQGPELWRIDPGTAKSQSVALPDHGPTVALALTSDAVWATHPDGTLTRTSVNSLTTTEIKVGRGPSGIAVADDVVWVANTGDGTISRVDPKTNAVVATIHVGGNPVGIAIVGGQPFVTLRGS